jgi:NADH-quinone oxidoreductase subunit G
VAAARSAGRDVPQALRDVSPSAVAQRIAASLASGERRAILLGNYAIQHRDASQIAALAQMLASITGATLGVCGEAANSVGGYLAGALPQAGGRNAQAMLGADGGEPRRAYLVLHAEPEFDCAHPVSARAALEKADLVVVLSPFRTATRYADVLLPVAPFTETSGTFVSCEGRVQPFLGVAQPLGDTRPAWKVLRVLGTMLSLEGFAFDTSEEVRESVLRDAGDIAARLATSSRVEIAQPARVNGAIERVADVPIYFADPLVRRSRPLQETKDAAPPKAWMNAKLMARLGVAAHDTISARSAAGEARLAVARDDGLPDECVRISAAHPSTADLGAMFGAISVEKVAAARPAGKAA